MRRPPRAMPSRTPSAASARTPFAGTNSPVPVPSKSGRCSTTLTSHPSSRIAPAAASPAMPAPATSTCGMCFSLLMRLTLLGPAASRK